MPHPYRKKVHYEKEAGKSLCKTNHIARGTSDPENVSCSICRNILRAQKAASRQHSRMPKGV